jgi:hypothetical protein
MYNSCWPVPAAALVCSFYLSFRRNLLLLFLRPLNIKTTMMCIASITIPLAALNRLGFPG